MHQFIGIIQEKVKDCVVRRGIHSVDNQGCPISGLPYFLEHILLLSMYDWERENLAEIASELVEDRGAALVYGAGKVSGFPLCLLPIVLITPAELLH